MDQELKNVSEFHTVFGCSQRAGPGWPKDLSGQDLEEINNYALALADLARKLKSHAAFANGQKRHGLGLLLVRLQLQVEETAELAEAIAAQDMVEALDALTDIGYVTNGTYLTLGLGAVKALAHRIVHESNMSKLGEDGQPIIGPSGRVIKGPNYRDPKERLKFLLVGE